MFGSFLKSIGLDNLVEHLTNEENKEDVDEDNTNGRRNM